ncbi:Uncharacterised protein [Mycobacteroides abscessus subsp. abscessus]|nr:Uncharacterised protein [Mycobacteroides abscessus subsp. abscessus]
MVDTVCPCTNIGLPKRHIDVARNILTGNGVGRFWSDADGVAGDLCSSHLERDDEHGDRSGKLPVLLPEGLGVQRGGHQLVTAPLLLSFGVYAALAAAITRSISVDSTSTRRPNRTATNWPFFLIR